MAKAETAEEVVSEVAEEVTEQEQTTPPEVEEKARKMGWTSKDEFKGDPEKWRDASEFVERGETMLPILKKTVEKQAKQIDDLHKSIKEFSEYHTKTEQRAYERAIKDLKAKQLEAVSAGDTTAFVQIDKEIGELQQDAATIPKNTIDHVYNEWADNNKWVDNDPQMVAFAEAQAIYINKTKPGASYAEKLEEVTKAVKKEFPDKFTNPRRDAAPTVEGSHTPSKKGGKSFADMPADARAACERAVKNYGIKKENWVKTYFDEN